MNTRKNSFFSLLLNLHIEILWRKEGSLELGVIHNPQKLVHMQRRALAAESDYVRKIASSQSSSSLSFSANACEKGRSLFSFSLIGHIQLLISLPPCLGSGGSRGKQTAAPLSSERDRTRAELLHRKSSQCTQISPQGHRVRAPCPNKRRKDCVCHCGGSRFYPHTILNALLVLAIW